MLNVLHGVLCVRSCTHTVIPNTVGSDGLKLLEFYLYAFKGMPLIRPELVVSNYYGLRALSVSG